MPEEKNGRMLKAALYARVSTEMQAEKNTSIPVQLELLQKYVENNLHIRDTVSFSDAGFSGTNTNRPAFKEMMARAQGGEFSHILVFKFDRISRSLLDFCLMYQEFKKWGVTFVSIQENFDTSTAMGEAMLKFLLVFAEMEVSMTKQRVTTVMLSRARRGKYNGGRASFGYSWDGKNLYINEKEAPVVREIFRLFLDEDYTTYGIAKHLFEHDIFTRSGRRFTQNSVEIILKNPIYKGTYVYNRRKNEEKREYRDKSDWISTEGFAPAIIEAERFDLVQERFQKETEKWGLSRRQYTPAKCFFYHLLFCGECGNPFTSRINRKSSILSSTNCCLKANRYFTCGNKTYWSDTRVGNFVLTYIRNLLLLESEKDLTVPKLIERLTRDLLPAAKARDPEITSVSLKNPESILLALDPDAKIPYLLAQKNTEVTNEKGEAVKAELQKYERALSRLKDLYLFDESAMSGEEFLEEKKRIESRIELLKGKLPNKKKKEAPLSSVFSDKNSKLNLLFMMKAFAAKGPVSFQSVAEDVDRNVIYDFLHKTIEKIVIRGKRIESIAFTSGMVHTFSYGDGR